MIKPNCGNPPRGNYALEGVGSQPIFWYYCREKFLVKFDEKTQGFFFSHDVDKGKNIANFISKFESILKLTQLNKPYTTSTFSLTDHENVLWINVSSFWSDCLFKRSLFTALLRSGSNYDLSTDNFDEALFSPTFKDDEKVNLYMRQTKNAVLRFMFGFTKYVGVYPSTTATEIIRHGWKDEFMNISVSKVRNKLILPEEENVDNNIVGLETLWGI
jgi:hypothetical protein